MTSPRVASGQRARKVRPCNTCGMKSIMLLLVVVGYAASCGMARAAAGSVKPVAPPAVQQQAGSVEVVFAPAADHSGKLPIGLGRIVLVMSGPDSADGKKPDAKATPRFAKTVADLKPGQAVQVDDSWEHAGVAWSKLPAGDYQMTARLMLSRQTSSWESDAGNWRSEKVPVKLGVGGGAAGGAVRLVLEVPTTEREWKPAAGVKLVEVESKVLTAFFGKPTMVRAAVVAPITPRDEAGANAAVAADRKFAAVYEVPGFGGDHRGANRVAQRRARMASGGAALPMARRLAEETYWVMLDPESPNGHTLFADSVNNGPRGQALVQELIPEIERQFPMLAKPEGRLLRGHSSGGWSTLWLGLNYPETFGAMWSTSPDPVDFRRFQTIDIYSQENAYFAPASMSDAEQAHAARLAAVNGALGAKWGAKEVPEGARETIAKRGNGGQELSVFAESRSEDMIGGDNTSGGQWDSWFAVFGAKNERGNPQALFDDSTGKISPAVAATYKKYDIGAMIRQDPAKFIPLMQQRVRLVVGTTDEYFLDQAVALLAADVERLLVTHGVRDAKGERAVMPGYIAFAEGKDHGTVYNSQQVLAFDEQMVQHLIDSGAAAATAAPAPKR